MSGFSHGATTKPTLTLPSPFDKESLVRVKGAVSTEPCAHRARYAIAE